MLVIIFVKDSENEINGHFSNFDYNDISYDNDGNIIRTISICKQHIQA